MAGVSADMTESAPAIVALAAARAEVLARIAAACARVGRDPAEVTLVAVSKTVEVGRLRDAVAGAVEDDEVGVVDLLVG